MSKLSWRAKAVYLIFAFALVFGLTAVAMPTPQQAVAADGQATNTLRVYGRCDQDAAFPYTDPNGPFSPQSWEAPPKDFIQWNPAYMYHLDPASNGIYGSFFQGIVVNGNDANEKVHLRQWYVPKYPEPRGNVWTEQAIVPSPDIVKEYTYLLLDTDNNPIAGLPGMTSFVFPIADNDEEQCGLDDYDMNRDGVADIVYLDTLSNTVPPGTRGFPVAPTTPTPWIDISTGQFAVSVGDEIRFLDHSATITGLTPGISITLQLAYIGNHADSPPTSVTIPVGNTLSAGRHLKHVQNLAASPPAPPASPPLPPSQSAQFLLGPAGGSWLELIMEPWYLQVITSGADVANIIVGRLIAQGETFFVDGAEYDVAKIHKVWTPDGDAMKYITIRNPIPKYDEVTLEALTIIKCAVQEGEPLPLLPPFNMEHDMIDDINIPDYVQGDPNYVVWPDHQDMDNPGEDIWPAYDTIAERRVQDVGPIVEWFEQEDKEPRFDTNLLEEKFYKEDMVGFDLVESEPDDEEAWWWKNIETLPWDYTEFVLPELPDITDPVNNDDGDYILVSSWITEDSIVSGRMGIVGGWEDITRVDDTHGTFSGELFGPSSLPPNRHFLGPFAFELNTGIPGGPYVGDGFLRGVTTPFGLRFEDQFTLAPGDGTLSGPVSLTVTGGWLSVMDGQFRGQINYKLRDGTSVTKDIVAGFLLFPVRVKFVHDAVLDAVWSADIYVNDASYNRQYQDVDEMSLRVYGRCDRDAAFPYNDPNGPFSPQSTEAPPKDFIQWNPAYMYHLDPASNGIYGSFFQGIVVNGNDANEKVHLRQWYVPKYPEPRGNVWTEQAIVPSPDIVKEYTYLLLDTDNNPIPGLPGMTSFVFPIADNDEEQCGLDDYDMNRDGVADIVYLEEVSNVVPPNTRGFPNPPTGPWIDINTGQFAVSIGDEIRFLDHAATITGITPGVSITVELAYIGNHADSPAASVTIPIGNTLSAGRHLKHVQDLRVIDGNPVITGVASPPNPPSKSDLFLEGPSAANWLELIMEPWYLQVITSGAATANIVVGRLIAEAETFFVDGAEYDVAKIHKVPTPDGEAMKYITIRNPIPKYDEVTLEALTIIKCAVQELEPLPMLPPFNMEHDMIDDINIPDALQGNPNVEVFPDVQNLDNVIDEPDANGDGIGDISGLSMSYNTIAKRRVQDVGPIVEYFKHEAKEPRFDTNLLEEKIWELRLRLKMVMGDEYWMWKNIETLPWDYTEFVLPELPDITDPVDNDDGDYILVSSFVTEDREYVIYWAWTYYEPPPPADPYWEFQGGAWFQPVRVKFQYDAAFGPEEKTGVYVNTIGVEVPPPTPTPSPTPPPPDACAYDGDDSGAIEVDEALVAIADYFGGVIDISLVLEVISLYFSGEDPCAQ